MTLVDVRDLKIDFSTPKGILQAVRGVSFALRQGEILGIVGESGSGKSVTAHTLLGLLPGNGSIRGGEILYKNRPVLTMGREELRRFRGNEMGIIFQEPSRSFDPIYSMERTFAETILTHRPELPPNEVLSTSVRLLEEVQVPQARQRLSNFPHQFSGGLLQRVMIALALASDPDVLIADEPTTALDVTIQAQIIRLLLELKEKRGLSIIFISHNLALIGSMADRILVMYGGLVLEDGPAEQVLGAPCHPYTRALLDSHLAFGDHYSENSLKAITGTTPDPHIPEPGCPFAPRCPLVADRCSERIPDVSAERGTTDQAPVRKAPAHKATTPKAAASKATAQRTAGADHSHRCIFPGVKESLYA
ncbi:MAG TPA: ABC transporter ATP-binding protein [Spirochaetia bacterium]|nr:ABC transporter ATP-binding protein [Spirochaetia bacterium]